jgi:hypothetical protein
MTTGENKDKVERICEGRHTKDSRERLNTDTKGKFTRGTWKRFSS